MPYLILHQNRAIVRVAIADIYYVSTHPTKAHALIFITTEGEFEASMPLSKLEENSRGSLLRCHRKFLVNPARIKGINYDNRSLLFMEEGISDIVCSRRYFALLKDIWKNTEEF